jgi:nitrite reductase (NADH) large subunit
MCGLHFLRRLRDLPGSWRVTVFERESGPPYDRLRLTGALAGSAGGDLAIEPLGWFQEAGIELRDRTRVVRLEPRRRWLEDGTGRRHAYDICVLATGSEPVPLPIPGLELEGVSTFRTLDDARTLAIGATVASSAVVIGGGLLGIEVAAALRQRGLPVTIVHLAGRLMERQLDAEAALLLQASLERRGIRCRLGQTARSIAGTRHVEAVLLQSGEVLDADLVVVCIGVRPDVSLARAAGLRVARAVVVDDQMRTSAPGVYAIGDCSEHRGRTFGLVGPGYEQAAVLARHLAGDATARMMPGVEATTLRAGGVDVFAGGRVDDQDGERSERLVDEAFGVYRRLVFRDDVLVGAVLLGDLSTRGVVTAALGQRRPPGSSRELLVSGDGVATAIADDEPVCGCRGVTAADIRSALGAGCRTAVQVSDRTGAGRSCGTCLPTVEQLVKARA